MHDFLVQCFVKEGEEVHGGTMSDANLSVHGIKYYRSEKEDEKTWDWVSAILHLKLWKPDMGIVNPLLSFYANGACISHSKNKKINGDFVIIPFFSTYMVYLGIYLILLLSLTVYLFLTLLLQQPCYASKIQFTFLS